MNQKDENHLSKMLVNIDFILEHMESISEEDLKSNALLLDSMMLRIVQISENAKYLSEATIELYNEIPWYLLSGLRNRIVHDYGNVDIKIIYDTLTKDIPILKEKLQNIL